MTKPKPKLQDLLNKCDETIPMSKEDKKWDKMRPFGKEYGSGEDGKDQPEIEIKADEL